MKHWTDYLVFLSDGLWSEKLLEEALAAGADEVSALACSYCGSRLRLVFVRRSRLKLIFDWLPILSNRLYIECLGKNRCIRLRAYGRFRRPAWASNWFRSVIETSGSSGVDFARPEVLRASLLAFWDEEMRLGADADRLYAGFYRRGLDKHPAFSVQMVESCLKEWLKGRAVDWKVLNVVGITLHNEWQRHRVTDRNFSAPFGRKRTEKVYLEESQNGKVVFLRPAVEADAELVSFLCEHTSRLVRGDLPPAPQEQIGPFGFCLCALVHAYLQDGRPKLREKVRVCLASALEFRPDAVGDVERQIASGAAERTLAETEGRSVHT